MEAETGGLLAQCLCGLKNDLKAFWNYKNKGLGMYPSGGEQTIGLTHRKTHKNRE